MSSIENELLGPAERHVVKKLSESFKQAHKELNEVLGDLEALSETDFAKAMLDSEKKEAVIGLVEVIEQLPRRVGDMRLLTLFALAMFDTEALKERRGR